MRKKTFINLCSAQTKAKQRNSTKQARLFELAFAARRGSFFHFRKKNINRVWKSRWSQFVESLGLEALALLFSSQAQIRERVGFSRKGKRFFLVPFLEPIRGCVKGLLTEKQSLHVLLTCVRQADYKVWIALPKHKTRLPTAALFLRLAKQFKLYRQLAERKREGREGTTFP